ncbi:M4 family metallopeptidase [Hymenobacter sp.]|uniref:M4 family metallopeptidase n=1 Tax=Hymenobacter sp. TaxID=1898978 RepID=UPI00286A068B|nr:M4 family metallopeptidase [Hymenobacter sp.]
MKKHYSAAALLMLGTLAATTARAQDAARIQTKVLGEDSQPELVRFSPAGKAAYRAADAQQVLRQQLALTADDQLLPLRTETDQLGLSHQKFAQHYKGIRVERADYSVHLKGGAIESISGDFEKIAGLSTTPKLSAAAALSRALDFVGARRYMWQDAAEEAGLKQQEDNPAATYRPAGELVIVRSSLTGQRVLAWKFNIYAQQPVSRAYVYVDAQSGQVVSQDAIIKHAAATGTFATRYSGTRSSATETATGGFRLRELTRGLGIETYNARKGSSYTAAVDFIDADNSWTEYNNANFDDAALDAHWGAQSTYDYWKNVHGRNSWDNGGAKIKSYIHFDDTPGDGVGFENAYWNGSVMTYGDGASRFRPLTSLDVCAHEIGHAVCERTANLAYENESGAMNEGFSDIWGAAVEFYAAPAKATWLIGEDIDKVRPALRSMSNPNAEGQPDTYKGTNWRATTTNPTSANDYGGVHTNSGVLNFWFYLLSVGGSGTNDIGNAYSVATIGIDKAARIAYRTESVYLSGNSTYANARTFSIQAATDLYGAGSAEVTAVTNAWFAVGVGAAAGGTTPPPTGATYCTVKGNNQAYEWIDLVNLGSINRTSGSDAGYYNGTALSTSIAAGSAQTIRFSVGFAGTAYTEYWKIYIDYNANGLFTDAGELVVSGSSSSAATLSSNFTVPATARTGATRLRLVLSDNAATASCGTFTYGEAEDYTVNITGGAAIATGPTTFTGGATPLGNELARTLELYPNPATEAVRLVLPGNAPAVRVTVTDLRGARVAGATFSDGTLNISRLAKGMYTLSVSDGQKVFHQRFVKE